MPADSRPLALSRLSFISALSRMTPLMVLLLPWPLSPCQPRFYCSSSSIRVQNSNLIIVPQNQIHQVNAPPTRHFRPRATCSRRPPGFIWRIEHNLLWLWRSPATAAAVDPAVWRQRAFPTVAVYTAV
ncbi:hypothetical protein P154DRAFT_224140 [Amniculicola lignicola CBS 123094]|uniref:Uncharacterized protein n=1 Tax=Amniculicola lignicola CBS 123094 TaxID=1392246 RepID=A0A6A5WYI1_9PLEO|nr:hypothetical protein P154DRAFT_224140 [Amniculicola lignicola CBS 123094]